MNYAPLSDLLEKLRLVFDDEVGIIAFRRENPPVEGDTITVNGLVAEFKKPNP